MNRILRWIFIGAGALLLLAAAGIGIAVMVVNPNDYKPEIEAAVLRATGKPLVLEGDLSLSLFPGISITAGPARLNDDASFGSAPFVSVEKVSASVALLPLLRGNVNIGTVDISGVRVKLAVNKSGKTNWTLEKKSAPAKTPATAPQNAQKADTATTKAVDLNAISLEKLTIKDTTITYADMRSGESMEAALTSLELTSLKVGEKTTLTLNASYAGATPKPLALTLNAAFTLPGNFAENTAFTAEGKLDDTPFTLKGTFALPQNAEGPALVLSADFAANAINLDKYKKPAAKGGTKTSSGKTPTPATPPAKTASDGQGLRNALRAVRLDLRLAVKALTVANVPVSDIKGTVKIDNGLLVAKPVTMTVANGPLSLEANLDAREKTARSRVTGGWKKANIGQLIKALTGKTPLTGTLDADWNLAAAGLGWPVMAKSLAGKASFGLTDGKAPAFTLIPKGIAGLPSQTMDIDIVTCTATWNIANGIAKNDDLALQAVTLKAQGGGQVNIPTQTMDYRVSVELPTIKNLPNLTVLPVVIAGPLASLSYSIDQPAIVRDTAKSLLDPGTKTGKEIRKGLGNVLGKLKKK